MEAAPKRTGPVLIAYDGTDAADRAIREAGALLEGRPALVLTVWKSGLGFELVANPAELGVPMAPIDVRTAIDIDEASREHAQRTAQKGAELAKQSGFAQADALAVADEPDVTVADTIIDAARDRDAQAIVVAAHRHGRLSEVVLGTMSRDVVRSAPCPVLVVPAA